MSIGMVKICTLPGLAVIIALGVSCRKSSTPGTFQDKAIDAVEVVVQLPWEDRGTKRKTTDPAIIGRLLACLKPKRVDPSRGLTKWNIKLLSKGKVVETILVYPYGEWGCVGGESRGLSEELPKIIQEIVESTTATSRQTDTVYPTIEDAAVAAWEFETDLPSEKGPRCPGNGLFDRTATLNLLKSKAEKIKVDLNGDRVDEVLMANGSYVNKAGKETSYDGAQNRSWAVLQKIGDGWRVVGSGWGSPCPPQVLAKTTNGWKDLESGYHLSAGSGASHLYQFDGKRYTLTNEIEYGHRKTLPASSDEARGKVVPTPFDPYAEADKAPVRMAYTLMNNKGVLWRNRKTGQLTKEIKEVIGKKVVVTGDHLAVQGAEKIWRATSGGYRAKELILVDIMGKKLRLGGSMFWRFRDKMPEKIAVLGVLREDKQGRPVLDKVEALFRIKTGMLCGGARCLRPHLRAPIARAWSGRMCWKCAGHIRSIRDWVTLIPSATGISTQPATQPATKPGKQPSLSRAQPRQHTPGPDHLLGGE